MEFGRYGVLVEVNTAYRDFLKVGTTFNIFQNIYYYILDTTYRGLLDTAYRSLFFMVSCEVQVQICRIFFDGYGVLDVKTIFFIFLRSSSRMLMSSMPPSLISLGITFGFERGLRMGRTDAEFEEASQNVSNFFLRAQAQFDEAISALPSTHFPFLTKISKAVKSSLPEVASIQPDKVVCSVMTASALTMSSPVGKTFGWTPTMKDSGLTGLAHDAPPSLA
nr:hypothetical protein [Tanacetum cinerariifolium]